MSDVFVTDVKMSSRYRSGDGPGMFSSPQDAAQAAITASHAHRRPLRRRAGSTVLRVIAGRAESHAASPPVTRCMEVPLSYGTASAAGPGSSWHADREQRQPQAYPRVAGLTGAGS